MAGRSRLWAWGIGCLLLLNLLTVGWWLVSRESMPASGAGEEWSLPDKGFDRLAWLKGDRAWLDGPALVFEPDHDQKPRVVADHEYELMVQLNPPEIPRDWTCALTLAWDPRVMQISFSAHPDCELLAFSARDGRVHLSFRPRTDDEGLFSAGMLFVWLSDHGAMAKSFTVVDGSPEVVISRYERWPRLRPLMVRILRAR